MAKAIVYKGDKKTYELVTGLPVPKPQPGQVVVHITLRPLNIMDPIFAPIVYQQLGKPLIPGYEGFGIVHAVGEGVTKLKLGQRVVPFLLHHGEQGSGSWQEYITIAEDYVWPVPDSVSDETAAQFVINPWTAFGIVEDLQIPKGEYLLQTAAASVLGRYVIILAKHYFGIKTINVVRRKEQVSELKALGADEVICTIDEDIVTRVKSITNNLGAYAALDCVGGAATKPVGASVRDDGTVIVFGSMGGTFDGSASLPDFLRGVKLTGWSLLRSWEAKRNVFVEEVGKLVETKVFPEVGGEKVAMEHIEEAFRKAKVGAGGAGKVLLSSPGKRSQQTQI